MTDHTPDETPTGRTAEPEARERALNRARLLVKRGEVHDLYPHVMYKTDEVSAIAWLLEQYDALEAQAAACRNGSDWAMAEQFESDLKRMTEERDAARAEALELVERLVSYGLAIGKLGDLLKETRRQLRMRERVIDQFALVIPERITERDAALARAQEAQATAAHLVDLVSRIGESWLNATGVETCSHCRETDCVDAEVSTCIGWQARRAIRNLPAATKAAIARTARLDAFVAALPDELESTLISAGECLICGALPEEDDGRHFPDCAGESLILAVQAAVGIEGGTE